MSATAGSTETTTLSPNCSGGQRGERLTSALVSLSSQSIISNGMSDTMWAFFNDSLLKET